MIFTRVKGVRKEKIPLKNPLKLVCM